MKRLTDEDFNLLLPGEVVKLGKTDILIKPVSPFSDDFKLLYLRLKELESIFKESEITFQNFPYKLPVVTEIIFEHAPDILSMITDIHEDDLKRLPLGKIAEIIETIMKVNQKSYEGFEKNLNTWMGEAVKMLRGVTLILSIFSSGADTAGTRSKVTQPVK